MNVRRPDDPLEIEAEAVADSIVDPAVEPGPAPAQGVSSAVQPQSRTDSVTPSSDVSDPATASASGNPVASDGQRAGDVWQRMGSAFGADVGQARIHTDSHSDELARSLSARAFTTGRDVYFRAGEYQPQTETGSHLLAHELTHVVQQSGGALRQGGSDPSGTVQRYPEAVVVTKQSGAGIHKSNRKKVAAGTATELNVRSGGIFGTGIKVTVPVNTSIMVDYAMVSSDGAYILAQYTDESGTIWTGYINKANVQQLTGDEEESVSGGTIDLDFDEEEEFEEMESEGEDQLPEDVEADMLLAHQLLSGYLKSHTIGQHMKKTAKNREALQQEGMVKASEAESWAIGELKLGEKRAESAQQSELEIAETKKALLKKPKSELIELLIQLDPSEAVWKEAYEDKETGVYDLVNLIVNKQQREKEQSGDATGLQEEVYSDPEFWMFKGQQLLDVPMSKIAGGHKDGKTPIWCDQSTAIIIATLANNKQFTSPLEVIKQGDPKQHGHWYVLANRDPDASAPKWGDELEGNEFIIDIWGTLRLNEPDFDEDAQKWVWPHQYNSVVHRSDNPGLLNVYVGGEEAEDAIVVDPVEQDVDESEIQKRKEALEEAAQNKMTVMARVPGK